MTIKTSTLKCELNPTAATLTYRQCTRDGEAWKTEDEQAFDLAALPEPIRQWCAIYGLRAVLADRTSDSKKLGINKLEWMRDLYKQFEAGEWNKARASAKTVDKALTHLIVELKGCTVVEAEAALKQADKAWIEAAMERYAEDLTRIRKTLSAAQTISLDDL